MVNKCFAFFVKNCFMEELRIQVSSRFFKVFIDKSAYIIYDQEIRLGKIYFENVIWKSEDRMDEYLLNRLGYAIEQTRKLK